MIDRHLPGIDAATYIYRRTTTEVTDTSILLDEIRRLTDEVERLRRVIEGSR